MVWLLLPNGWFTHVHFPACLKHIGTFRSAELLMAIHQKTRDAFYTHTQTMWPEMATSTPSQARSARPSISFAEGSPMKAAGTSQISTQTATQSSQGGTKRHPYAPELCSRSPEEIQQDLEWEVLEEDDVIRAQTVFESGEYYRIDNMTKDCKSAKARFFGIYAAFLDAEAHCNRYWYKVDSMS
jgi:hypothetical protein